MAQALQHYQAAFIARISPARAALLKPPPSPSGDHTAKAVVSLNLVQKIRQAKTA